MPKGVLRKTENKEELRCMVIAYAYRQYKDVVDRDMWLAGAMYAIKHMQK